MDNVQEMLALPFKVKPVATFDNMFTLYSSNRLKLKFAKMLTKEKLTRPASSKLSKLVFKGKIVPAFVSKGMLRYFASKLLGNPMRGIAGFYNPKTKKIYVLVDTQSNIFGFSSDKILSYTAVHECMHMCASFHPGRFWSLFKDYITKYYDYVFRYCLGIEPGVDFDVGPIRDFLWNNFELGWKSASKSTIVKYGKLLQEYKKVSFLPPNKFEERVEHIQFIMIAAMWKPQAIQGMYYKKDYEDLFRCLYNGYKKVFKIKKPYNYTFAYQEFLIPSEIICIQAANPNSKNYAAINAI
jgi:hypothetical protein